MKTEQPTAQAAKQQAPPSQQPSATTATPSPAKAEESKPAQASAQAAQSPAPSAERSGNGHEQSVEELRRTKSSPLVRNIAREHGIDISRLEGTGMSGRVTKNDILSFIESGATAAQPRAAAAGTPSHVAPQKSPALGAPGTQAAPVTRPV